MGSVKKSTHRLRPSRELVNGEIESEKNLGNECFNALIISFIVPSLVSASSVTPPSILGRVVHLDPNQTSADCKHYGLGRII